LIVNDINGNLHATLIKVHIFTGQFFIEKHAFVIILDVCPTEK